MNLIFVHANAAATIYQSLSKDFSAKEPPQWTGLLANHVRSRGHQTAIIDAECEGLSIKQTIDRIKDYKPKIVCFISEGQNPNSSSQSMEGAVRTAEYLRQEEPSIKILFGGQHVSAVPDDVLQRHSCVDFVLQNEGVYTCSQFCEVSNLNDELQLEKVQGLAWRDKEGNFNFNDIGDLVPKGRLSIDLPGIAWDLLPSPDRYRTANWHSWTNGTENSPFVSLYTTFGCPYQCGFCMINIINRTQKGPNVSAADSNVYRAYDPQFIIDQFDKFAAMGVKNVKLVDELFVYNPKHFMPILDLLIERNYGFNIWCYSRIDTCKESYLEKLKKAGINWLALGVENPQQILRKEVHKGGFKDVRITDLFKMIENAGINVGANYIFGLPMDTHESMKYTQDFMMENLTAYMNVYPAQAFPGSPLHLEAKQKGWKLPETYSGYSMHAWDTQNLATDNLSAAEILKMRDDTILKYFTNPSYLKMMESKFGSKCIENINNMTKIKLPRKLLGDSNPNAT